MRARSSGVTTPFALVLVLPVILHAGLTPQQLLGFVEVQIALLHALKMRCCSGVLACVDQGVPAKLVADVTARSSEARITVLITILLLAVAGCDDTMSALGPAEHAQGWVTRGEGNVRCHENA